MASTLSKSDFLLFRSHPCWLWLKKNDPSKLPKVDDNLQARFDSGFELESFAERLYPGGTRLGFETYEEFETLPTRTAFAISQGASVLFQARFDFNQFTVISDIVEVVGDRKIQITEIKSSTSVKPKHVIDLAFQRFVLEKCGYSVEKCSVLTVNTKYVRDGDVDHAQLFATNDVTAEVEEIMDLIRDEAPRALSIVGAPTMPNPSPRHCGSFDKEILSRWIPIFKALEQVPEQSIYDLPALKPEQVAELEDLGIKLIVDIPADFKLGRTQKPVVEGLQKSVVEIHSDRIREFLSEIKHPIYFLDYESFMDALPPFQATRPYQQLTIQYSLHVLDQSGSEPTHHDYIHQSTEPPFKQLAAKLHSEIGENGSVIVWNKTFEVGRNKELGEMLPEFTEFFVGVNARIVDLMDVFKQGMYAHPEFMGSASIKRVLPVVVPDLSYKEMEVQEGLTASRLWKEVVMQGKGSDGERKKVLEDLLSYCKLDTLAMVRIYQHLATL